MSDVETIRQLYAPAAEVAGRLREIIRAYHKHLANCRFALLFRTDGAVWLKRRRVVHAQVRRVNDLTNAIIMAEAGVVDGIDMVLIINRWVWDMLDDAGKDALLDHELSHVIVGAQGGYTLDDHDVQEFSTVARRHGAWSEGLKQLEKALCEHGQQALPGIGEVAADGTQG